ncbi:5'-3' DNA helicase ZGRF1 [Pyxicephalus adspersus]|uniref:5'-3' DNA helicase ZGRF1 n=1 Tax=Pyxicephalus adspersus TaxID=30357 RepID=UPI003B5B6ADF
MAIQEFTVLYTHQKTKKSKVWQDGVLMISSGGNQASLYNDKGQRLDNVFIRTGKVNIGDDLESDRFLITVEAEGASSNTSENNTESKDVPLFKRYGLKSAGLRPPVGLKRKFTGFQCPREITKKPCPEVEESGKISSQQEQGCPSLSSPLFTTSPLFASTFSKKANTARAAQCQSSIQPDDYSYMCENQHSATSRITPVNDNTFSTNFSSNRNQAKSENFTGINVLEDGNRTKPSLRSTAQILALLKSQPSKEGTLTNLAGQHIDQAPAKSDSDLLGSTFAGGASSLKCENISLDPSTVKPHCVKSRWDVYLDPPSAPSTVYGDDNDSFVLSQSPDDRFKNNNKYCILSHGLEQEKMKGGSTWTMDKYMEGENTPMTEHKLNELEHVGNPSQKRLSNAEENCEHNLCGSGLGLTEPPTPMLCSSFHNPTKLELDDVESENENVTSFAEVSFNLMDSFDLNELDDGGSNGTPPLPQNRIVSAKEDMDKNQEYTIEEEKALCRTCPLAIQLSVCEDVTTVPSSTEPMLSTFSPVHEDDDPQTLFVAQSNSPPMIPPACQEEQTVLTPAMNSAIFALDETFSDYSGSSQPAFVHTVTSHESNSFSPAQHPLPRWTLGSQGSECDWEFSQWTKSKVETPTQEKSDDLKRPFFLRPRQSFSVDSPGTQLKNGTSVLKQHNFLNTTRVSKVQTRIHKQLPMITQPEFVTSSLNPLEDEYDVLEIQKENSLLLKTHSYRSNETHSTIVADKNEGGDDYFKWLDTGPTSMGPPKNVPVSSSKQPSKWLKYQHVSSESSENIIDEENTEFCAQSVFRHPERIEEIQIDDTAPKPQVGALKQRPCQQSDVVSKVELITKVLTPANGSLPRMARRNLYSRDTEDKQIPLSCDLTFPPEHIVLSASIPKRKVNIPAVFQSSAHYKQVFNASLAEYLNVIMFELSQRLHKAFSKVDMSFYTSSVVDEKNRKDNVSPFCLHQQPAKLVMVRKEGPNKGRFFYTCDAPKADQCKYFKWLDEVKGTLQANGKPESKLLMRDMNSLSKFIRCQNINLYEESQLMVRKISVYHKRHFGKFAKVVNTEAEFGGESKTKLYLKLNRKDNSSAYSKDDVWVVSKTLNFDPMDTFIACSVFFGPSANNDIEISPLRGYCPSNWQTNMIVHALLICNASTELTCMRNIQEHFNSSTLPLMPHLLTLPSEYEKPNRISRGKFKPPAITTKTSSKCEIPDHNFVTNLAKDMIKQFCLNEDQATALMQIALMMCSSDGPQKQQNPPITIIHGVFGAGKSYLLAVVVLFLVQLFENFNSPEEQGSSHWKLLISSSTNVAVDRVLLGLLDLGFHQFIRVGSIRKIAKPILPHSLHAGSENESEQLKELQALLKEDLSPGEKVYVRKSIEQHKLGTNKSMLGQVRVIGATCAACPFPCMSNLKFPVVILDECSQMTEPASLLPIARFQCEKLILVGDPKQLSPTIQGSEAAHECGLEQTLFDRLCLMGHQTVMLRTQYRCHPVISAVANELFYNGQLINGVSQEDRKPLLDWLPTLCFYNASGTEQLEGNNSFHNIEEANFTVKLIQSLIASGIQGSMIGVITLYKSQMSKICNLLGSMAYCDPVEMKAVQVSTVDAFQGAEKEIIILSCVRTRQVGFIDSEKRMNVALTRGRRHLLIVGSLACLRKNKLWEQVIHQCERQINGLKHVSQWDEKLSSILKLYQEKKDQELLTMQKKHPKGKAEKVKASLPT